MWKQDFKRGIAIILSLILFVNVFQGHFWNAEAANDKEMTSVSENEIGGSMELSADPAKDSGETLTDVSQTEAEPDARADEAMGDSITAETEGVDENPYKLDNYISKITMLVPSAGDKNTYVQASDDGIMNGSDVRISMDFSFANGIVTPEHKTMTYQLPANIKISDVQSGKVKSGDNYVGDYTISTTGYVTITYDDSFVNDNRAFDGNLTFDCQASLSNEQVAEGISFSGNPTVVPGGIKIVPNNDAFDINAVKSITEVVQTGADKYIT